MSEGNRSLAVQSRSPEQIRSSATADKQERKVRRGGKPKPEDRNLGEKFGRRQVGEKGRRR